MIDTITSGWLQRNLEQPGIGDRLYRLVQWVGQRLKTGWERIREAQQAMRARSARRSLRVTESVSLGDKRSVYLIEVDGQRMLVGASAAGVTLLSYLDREKEKQSRGVKELMFADVMENCETVKVPKRKLRAVPNAERAG